MCEPIRHKTTFQQHSNEFFTTFTAQTQKTMFTSTLTA